MTPSFPALLIHASMGERGEVEGERERERERKRDRERERKKTIGRERGGQLIA